MTYKEMKFRVKDEEHSREIQDALFKVGYRWFCKKDTVHRNCDMSYLFADSDGDITFLAEGDSFESYFLHTCKSVEHFLVNGEFVTAEEKEQLEKKMELKSMKIRINSPEHSEQVQNALFKLGYGWAWGRDKTIQYKDDEFLYAYGEMSDITRGSLKERFEVHNNPEYVLVNGKFEPLEKIEVVNSPKVMPLRHKKEAQRERFKEVVDAIHRYAHADMTIPREWIMEFTELSGIV